MKYQSVNNRHCHCIYDR